MTFLEKFHDFSVADVANAALMRNESVFLFAAGIFFLIFIVSHEAFGDYPVYEYDYKRYNYRKKPKSVR